MKQTEQSTPKRRGAQTGNANANKWGQPTIKLCLRMPDKAHASLRSLALRLGEPLATLGAQLLAEKLGETEASLPK